MDKARCIFRLTMVMLLVGASAALPGHPGAPPFKVAFIGDTGYDPHDTPALDSGFEQVLALVRSEAAQLLVIAGDFSYQKKAAAARVYFSTIDRLLGARQTSPKFSLRIWLAKPTLCRRYPLEQ